MVILNLNVKSLNYFCKTKCLRLKTQFTNIYNVFFIRVVMNIAENLNKINNQLASTSARLIAVTKTKPLADLQAAYDANCKVFGENKVQEMVQKWEELPKDIEWHLIGHLQSNKVKYMASFVSMIHSIDSLKLLQEVDKQAAKHNRVIACLLQIYIAQEDTKFGLSTEETLELLDSSEFQAMKNIKIVGLMGMATNTDDLTQIRMEFRSLKNLFDTLKTTRTATDNVDLQEISMGMSGDYMIAAEEGSTLVRVGSAIFGNR
jgi:pyridoxal phosphate enzyme (YggS family)